MGIAIRNVGPAFSNAFGKAPGYGDVSLEKSGKVQAKAKVAFAAETPLGTSVGGSSEICTAS
jgi:hypothetical protein